MSFSPVFFRKLFYDLPFVFFVENVFSWISPFKKNKYSWTKLNFFYLLFDFLLLFFLKKKKLFSIFQLFFECSVFFFFCKFSARNNPQKNRFLKKCFLQTLFFELFWKRDIFWTKNCSKIIIWISLKRKKLVLATNPSFYIHMRWRSHAAFSCHWSRPRDMCCIKPSLLILFFLLFFFWINQSQCLKQSL